MLILTRSPNGSIIIGDDIKVTVVSIQGNQVRIGIEAPKDVSILRDDAIKRGNEDNEDNFGNK